MNQTFQNLKVRGRTIRVDDNGLVCLTDLHNAAGYKKHRKPWEWQRAETTKRLIIAVVEKYTEISGSKRNYRTSSVLYSRAGRDGGTFAHPILALAYAEFLNEKLAMEVRETFLRYKAADATLADDILERRIANGRFTGFHMLRAQQENLC